MRFLQLFMPGLLRQTPVADLSVFPEPFIQLGNVARVDVLVGYCRYLGQSLLADGGSHSISASVFLVIVIAGSVSSHAETSLTSKRCPVA